MGIRWLINKLRIKQVAYAQVPQEIFDFNPRNNTLTLFGQCAAVRGEKKLFCWLGKKLEKAEPFSPSITHSLIEEVGKKVMGEDEAQSIYVVKITAQAALYLYLEGVLTIDQIREGRSFRRGFFSKEWVIIFETRLASVSSPIRLVVVESPPETDEESVDGIKEDEFPI